MKNLIKIYQKHTKTCHMTATLILIAIMIALSLFNFNHEIQDIDYNSCLRLCDTKNVFVGINNNDKACYCKKQNEYIKYPLR